jgi:hypothetical protein
MGYAFDLQMRLAAIKQQAEPLAGRLEIIGALHPMQVIQWFDWFDGLELDQKYVIDQRSTKYSPTKSSLSRILAGPLLHSR